MSQSDSQKFNWFVAILGLKSVPLIFLNNILFICFILLSKVCQINFKEIPKRIKIVSVTQTVNYKTPSEFRAVVHVRDYVWGCERVANLIEL